MGSCTDANICEKKQNLKEAWKFCGDIIGKENNITFFRLKGKINIFEVNNITEIQVKGKDDSKKKKFNLKGEESHNINDKKDPKKITFKIKGENKFYPKEIILIKSDVGKAKIESEYEYNGFGLCKLSLILNENEKSKMKSTEESKEESTEESTEEEIISNSRIGLKNLGNTCYINSSLQILFHIPPFIELIRGCSDFEDNIIESIYSIFKEIINLKKTNENKYSINPKKFLNLFLENHYSDYYNNYNQLDSEMFLEDLLWDINEELLQLTPIELNLPEPNTKKEEIYYEYLKNLKRKYTLK